MNCLVGRILGCQSFARSFLVSIRVSAVILTRFRGLVAVILTRSTHSRRIPVHSLLLSSRFE
jgi:hypothetical protein